MKKIAQIGTFDVENFGDLLFPTVLKAQFNDIEIDLFSPLGNMKKPFEEDIFVFSIKDLEEKCKTEKYQLIVIGGGDLIRVQRNIAASYVSDFYACTSIWQMPIIIGKKYQIPVIFNAVGVPMEFGFSEKKMTRLLLNNVDYLSVRDHFSKLFLMECGLDNVEVVPDTAFIIPEIYKKNELIPIKTKLVKEHKIPDEKYIVFQHNTINDEDTVYLKTVLNKLCDKYKKQILLLPIGYVHKDIKFMEKLIDTDNNGIFLYREKLSPKEMCAVLSCSDGYIGTSMHGAIISYAYGKNIVSINTARLTKITGFLENIDQKNAEVNDISQLEDVIKKQFEDKNDTRKNYEDVCKKIKKYFKNVKEKYIDVTIEKKEINNLDFDILQLYHETTENLNDMSYHTMQNAKVYFDFGYGYKESNSIAYKYTKQKDKYKINVKVGKRVDKVRIDPVESNLIYLKNLNINLDGKNTQFSIPYSFELENGILVNSLDPMIIIDEVSEGDLSIEFEAEVINEKTICKFLAKCYEQILNQKRENFDIKKVNEKLKTNNESLKTNLENELKTKESLNKKCDELLAKLNMLETQRNEYAEEIEKLQKENQEGYRQICEIYQSTSWKVSKPIRVIGNNWKKMVNSSKLIHKGYVAVKILQHGGIKLLINQIKLYKSNKTNRVEVDDNNYDALKIDSEYQDNIDFSDFNIDVKMMAFYLPQFHTFRENDEWWGKGFTEWTNVRSGDSRFAGHYQPRVPHEDFGYYDLSDIEILRKQAELAKQHGIYGFCFYYYWFSGKRLMEKPVDMLLQHPEIDLPFCLCWANENWTRAWDGQNRNVLIAQDYSDNDDICFMEDLKKYIDDERYIRINGKPLIMVYNPGQIPDCKKSFMQWRNRAKEIGIGEILIWTCQTSNNTAEALKIEDCIDAEVEFPPHNMWMDEAAIRGVDLHGKSAFLYNYPKVVDLVLEKIKQENKNKVPVHHGCMLAWDNAARRKDAWFTYCGFSLKSLYKWVANIAENARKSFSSEERFIFINAWNEWGEGTYLEPDQKYGYANINTVSKALMGIPFQNDLKIVNNSDEKLEVEEFENKDNFPKIAIQIHMFYLDTLEETIFYLNQVPYTFDCYISTDTNEKKENIKKMFLEKCSCRKVEVDVFENRGRDVAPFLIQMKDKVDKYKYICHIHSKKTKTNDHGNEWRKYIFTHLLGNKEYLKRVFKIFESDVKMGILMPETYPVLELQAEWGGNKEGVQTLLNQLGIEENLPKDPVFPVGNMFWARVDAVKKIFEYGLKQSDFPREAGQVNATIAHQIERSWIYIIKDCGYHYQKIFNNCWIKQKEVERKKRALVFLHYDKENLLSDDDLNSLKVFAQLCEDVLFITNSNLADNDIEKVLKITPHVLKRDNKGFDFGGWKEGLLQRGKEYYSKFDEVILLNNSCFPPVFDIEEMFHKMESQDIDFWGDTIFPYSSDGNYIRKECIPEHLQSYLMVFNSNVIGSEAFWSFWNNIPMYEKFIDVVGECESQFTKKLSDAGFTYAPYIRETYYMSRFLNNYAIPYEKPTSLLLLKDPLIKKKCYQYMDPVEKIKLEYLVKKIR